MLMTCSKREFYNTSLIYVLNLTCVLGEIKLPVVQESDVLPQIHRFFQPLRQRIYAVLFSLHHARFDRRQIEDKIKGKEN